MNIKYQLLRIILVPALLYSSNSSALQFCFADFRVLWRTEGHNVRAGDLLRSSLTKTSPANILHMLVMPIVPKLKTYIIGVQSIKQGYFFAFHMKPLHSAHRTPPEGTIANPYWFAYMSQHYSKLHGLTHLFLITTGKAKVSSAVAS